MEAPVRLSSEPLSKERHMEAKDYLAYIVNEIHTTIVATVDDEGLPVTAAIDISTPSVSSFILPLHVHKNGHQILLWCRHSISNEIQVMYNALYLIHFTVAEAKLKFF